MYQVFKKEDGGFEIRRRIARNDPPYFSWEPIHPSPDGLSESEAEQLCATLTREEREQDARQIAAEWLSEMSGD